MSAVVVREGGIASLRELLGVGTNRELARRLNVDESTVSRVAAGEYNPNQRFIASVLLVCPVKFEDIFEPVEDAQEEPDEEAQAA